MEEIMNDKWISIDEAAEYLGIKTVTLRIYIKDIMDQFILLLNILVFL